jgi:hypothetical protein
MKRMVAPLAGEATFAPITRMLRHPSTNTEVLATSSLYGFIVQLTTTKSVSEFRQLNRRAATTSFLLKIELLSDDFQEDISLPYSGSDYKSTDTVANFRKEAAVQQDIFLKSVTGGRPAICPSIALAKVLDGEEGRRFLEDLGDAEEMVYLTNYLLAALATENVDHLGVMVMEMVTNSVALGDFLAESAPADVENFRSSTLRPPMVTQVVSQAIAQVVRLYAEWGYVNVDLHAFNVLVMPQLGTTRLIDFGTVRQVPAEDHIPFYDAILSSSKSTPDFRAQLILSVLEEVDADEWVWLFVDSRLDHNDKALLLQIFDAVYAMSTTISSTLSGKRVRELSASDTIFTKGGRRSKRKMRRKTKRKRRQKTRRKKTKP